MRRRLTITNVASPMPMGAQAYEGHVIARARDALAQLAAPGESWEVRNAVVRSMRASLPGTHRLPVGRLASASPRARAIAGRALFARAGLVHRMNLELPPAPLEVITLHDVVAWKYSDESPPVAAAAEEARRAAAVVCVSRFTAMEAVDLLGIESPHVVPNGVEARWFDAEPLSRAALDTLGVDGPYVLAAGGASQRKNLAALAEAWPIVRAARPSLRLVMAGPPHPGRDALFARLPGVHLVGLLPADHVPGLYAAAAVLVVPSLDEGFGLPALEAMAVGTPVVAANRAALPEVVGNDGILVDPTATGLATGIVDAVSGGPELAAMLGRARARAARYTWEATALGHARIWREVAGLTGVGV